MEVKIDADLSAALSGLEELPEAVGKKLRYAAWQGAELLRDEVRIQAPRYHKSHYFYSKGSKNEDGSKKRYEFEPGDLRRSIFAFYDKAFSDEGLRAVYQVGWRASEGVKGLYEEGALKAVPYGYMVHNGTRRGTAANPFLDRAWQLAGERAEQLILRAVMEIGNGKDAD